MQLIFPSYFPSAFHPSTITNNFFQILRRNLVDILQYSHDNVHMKYNQEFMKYNQSVPSLHGISYFSEKKYRNPVLDLLGQLPYNK